jgi:MFS family permease
MVIITGLTAVVVLAIWIPVTTNAGIILFAAAFRLTSGAFISLAPALITQISDVSKGGVRIGAMYAVTSVANLTSNPISGGTDLGLGWEVHRADGVLWV